MRGWRCWWPQHTAPLHIKHQQHRTAMHGRGSMAPPCPGASCTHTPTAFCPLGALQDLLSPEQVPAILYGLVVGQLQWKRQALPQAGGVHLWSSAQRTIQGRSAAPLSPGDNDPKETQLLVATSKHTPSRAALSKNEGPHENRLAPLLLLTGHHTTLCTTQVPKFGSSSALGSHSLDRQI